MTPLEIQAWRKDLRKRLIDARLALAPQALEEFRHAMDDHLERAFGKTVHGVLAFCWPYKNEYDARHIAAAWRKRGVKTALPVIVQPRSPLAFREWHPGVKLEAGPLGIPYPVGSDLVTPDAVLLPVVGIDWKGYRLGYGGGYFDRTVASLAARPLLIGIAYECLFIETIHPLPHDIQVDYLVTERGLYRRAGEALRLDDPAGAAYSSPPCYAAEFAADFFGEPPEQSDLPDRGRS